MSMPMRAGRMQWMEVECWLLQGNEISKPGSYTLSYNFTDAAGNAAQAVTRTVNVVDTTAPVITLNGDANITHEAGDLYVDANASWTDVVDGSGLLVAAGEVNASNPGTYIFGYNYTDEAENAAQTVTPHGECGGYDCPGNYPEWRCECHP